MEIFFIIVGSLIFWTIGAILAYRLTWMALEWFYPQYICHVCEDAKKKMGLYQYKKYHGAHKQCKSKKGQ